MEAFVFSVVQLVICTGCGATKSFNSSVKVFEERLFRYTEPNVPQPLVPEKSALYETDTSPKVSGSLAPRPSASPAAIELKLIDPSASPASPLISVPSVHADPLHL